MTSTYLIVVIEHDKPLPEKDAAITDVLSERAYTWLHNKGLRGSARAVRVTSSLIDPTAARRPWETD